MARDFLAKSGQSVQSEYRDCCPASSCRAFVLVRRISTLLAWIVFVGASWTFVLGQDHQEPTATREIPGPVAAPSFDNSEMTNVTGMGLIVVMALKAVSDFLQWRTTRGEEKAKADLVRDLAVMAAERENAERDVERLQTDYMRMVESMDRLRERFDRIVAERDELRIQLAMATGRPPGTPRPASNGPDPAPG